MSSESDSSASKENNITFYKVIPDKDTNNNQIKDESEYWILGPDDQKSQSTNDNSQEDSK
jgi:hypothetical protein